ncbi:MAG: ankyrin repeat domain-containing protein [Pseudomonadota bacterium]
MIRYLFKEAELSCMMGSSRARGFGDEVKSNSEDCTCLKVWSAERSLFLRSVMVAAALLMVFVAARSHALEADTALDKELRRNCRWGKLDQVKKCLSNGASVDSKDPEGGLTPLHITCRAGHSHIARLLIERGAGVNAVNGSGQTPLMVAAANGRLRSAKQLLENGADIDVRDRQGRTALISAAEKGHTEVVKLLLKSGAAATVTDERGNTAEAIAVKMGHGGVEQAVKKFVGRNGAEGKSKSSAAAAPNGKMPGMGPVTARGAGPIGKGLHAAAAEGDLEGGASLIEAGADVNERDVLGNTPLIIAAIYGHLGMVQMLVERGADAEAVQMGGLKASDWAKRLGHLSIEQLLARYYELSKIPKASDGEKPPVRPERSLDMAKEKPSTVEQSPVAAAEIEPPKPWESGPVESVPAQKEAPRVHSRPWKTISVNGLGKAGPEIIDGLRILADSPVIVESLKDELRRAEATYAIEELAVPNTDIAAVALLGQGGVAVASTRGSLNGIRLNLGEPFLDRSPEEVRVYDGAPPEVFVRVGPESREWTKAVAIPVIDDGKVIGSLVGFVRDMDDQGLRTNSGSRKSLNGR